MSKDIAPILEGWDYQPDEIQVRIVSGRDGRDKIQMRIDLGLIQMEITGRPDGQRPFGFESLLEYHEARASATPEPLGLDASDCDELLREALQYYHRYLSLFHLQRFDLVVRDTARNLRLLAFVGRHVRDAHDHLRFDQYRPYIIMMRTRAEGLEALNRDDHRTALARVDHGIAEIRAFLREYDQDDPSSELNCRELGLLRRWRDQLEHQRPVGPVERLEQQLDLAVAREDYEEAARLRDQIQRLRGVTTVRRPF